MIPTLFFFFVMVCLIRMLSCHDSSHLFIFLIFCGLPWFLRKDIGVVSSCLLHVLEFTSPFKAGELSIPNYLASGRRKWFIFFFSPLPQIICIKVKRTGLAGNAFNHLPILNLHDWSVLFSPNLRVQNVNFGLESVFAINVQEKNEPKKILVYNYMSFGFLTITCPLDFFQHSNQLVSPTCIRLFGK